MTVALSDMKFLLSGGASNTDKDLSLGGIVSSTEVIFSPSLNNLFDKVTAAEAAAGDIEYRCVYLQNDHATDDIDTVTVWINSNTPSTSTTVAIGLDPAGTGNGNSPGQATTIVNENTAPSGVTFSTPTTEGAGLVIGYLDGQEMAAIWIRWTVTAGAAPSALDAVTLSVKGVPI